MAVCGPVQEAFGDELMHAGLVTSDGSCGENKSDEGDFLSRLYLVDALPNKIHRPVGHKICTKQTKIEKSVQKYFCKLINYEESVDKLLQGA